MNDRTIARILQIVFILFFIQLNSCINNKLQEDVERLMDTKLWFPTNSYNDNIEFVILRYIKPTSCTSCDWRWVDGESSDGKLKTSMEGKLELGSSLKVKIQ